MLTPTADSLLQKQAANQQAMARKMYESRQATLTANRDRLGLVELGDGSGKVVLQHPGRQIQGITDWTHVVITPVPAPPSAPTPPQGAVGVDVEAPASVGTQMMESENAAAIASSTKKNKQASLQAAWSRPGSCSGTPREHPGLSCPCLQGVGPLQVAAHLVNLLPMKSSSVSRHAAPSRKIISE